MSSKLRRAYQIWKKQGFFTLVKKTAKFIFYWKFLRRLTPSRQVKKGFVPNYGWISIDKKVKILDPYLYPREERTYLSKLKDKQRELGLILGHMSVTQVGDHVVIIGGGNGKTAVAAGSQVGANGKLTIYEGLEGGKEEKFGVFNIINTLKLNDIPDIYEVEHAFVGVSNVGHAKPNNHQNPKIHPKDLPECDVLEFDCHGSELGILENLEIRPRAMIIEVESWAYKQEYDGKRHPREILNVLSELGYTVIQQTSHRGKPLSSAELDKLFEIPYQNPESHVTLENEKEAPPILYAIRNEYLK